MDIKSKRKGSRSSALDQFFHEMGTTVEREWRAVGYDATRFPDIAAAVLEQFQAPKKIDPIDVIRRIEQTTLPLQRDVEASFSNLPLTVFNSSRCFIDVYFWLDGTTAIHQHGFAGAFQVLTGSSLHGHYQFRKRHLVSPHFVIGDLSLKEVQLLSRGDIRKIVPGPDYIHSLFHLNRPSTTLTVRTVGLPDAQPQFSYLYPGIGLDPFLSDPAIIKRNQIADVLLGMEHPESDKIIGEMLARSDAHTAFALLSTAHGYLIRDEPARLRGLSSKTDRWSALLEKAHKTHGKTAEIFAAAMSETQRQTIVINRRSYVTSTELRFFLALVLNLRDRKKILNLVRQRYPDQPALETVLNWVEELSRIKLADSQSNALGIDDFDDIHLLTIESLMKGKSLAQTQRALRKIFRDERPQLLDEKIKTRFEELRQNALLSNLFKPN